MVRPPGSPEFCWFDLAGMGLEVLGKQEATFWSTGRRAGAQCHGCVVESMGVPGQEAFRACGPCRD